MVSPMTRRPIHAESTPLPTAGDRARPLVAEPHRVRRVPLLQVGHLAGEELDVGAADADPFDVDDDLAGGRHRGRHLLHPALARRILNVRAHASCAHRSHYFLMTSANDLTAGSRLRSALWYAGDDRNAYIHRAWMRRGVPGDAFTGRPHIAIANTASDLTPCNAHLTEVAASVKNGVYEAGGIPLELPVVSLGETLVRPTAMLWRNMAAMATEEMLRANPIDGVVLLGGCDKTIPALLMAAASVDLPAVVVPGGPMLTGTSAAWPWAAAPTSGGCRRRSGPARSPRRSSPARSRP